MTKVFVATRRSSAARAGAADRRPRLHGSGDGYEAGDDGKGQLAVGQVVINRVRHPAFPKTICGVVFEDRNAPPAASSLSPATARSIAAIRMPHGRARAAMPTACSPD